MRPPPSDRSASGVADAYAPAEIAARVEAAGIAKTRQRPVATLALGILAGIFIGFGTIAFTVVTTGSALGWGPTRLLGGVAFSVGLILVVVAGGELFTGNNLLAMAWADRKITSRAVLANWALVYVANLVGAVALAIAVHLAGVHGIDGGAVGATAVRIAAAKVSLGFGEAFFRGVLCNALVCLAVWLCYAARDVTGKVLAIIFPIATFVAIGFEHSVANMYAIPAGWLAALDPAISGRAGAAVPIDLAGFVANLIPVTLGNIVGGAVCVALAYHVIYRRGATRT